MTAGLPEPRPGLVIRYSSLWVGEHRAGGEEGVKGRPCVVIIAIEQRDGNPIVTMVVLTHMP